MLSVSSETSLLLGAPVMILFLNLIIISLLHHLFMDQFVCLFFSLR